MLQTLTPESKNQGEMPPRDTLLYNKCSIKLRPNQYHFAK
jgi:hypothetical protein